MKPPAHLSTGKAAGYLGISINTVRRLLAEGQLTGFQIPTESGDMQPHRVHTRSVLALMQKWQLDLPEDLQGVPTAENPATQ
jgi:hypothetical protein